MSVLRSFFQSCFPPNQWRQTRVPTRIALAIVIGIVTASRGDGAVTDYLSTTTGTFTNNTGSPEVHVINVPSSGTILDLNVGMNLEHAWRGDVRVTLQSPNGTRVEIIALPTNDSASHFDVLLEDTSTNNLDDGTNNNTSTPNFESDRIAAPSNVLSAFNGEGQQGDWRFEFVDLDIGATNDRIGTFNLAKIQIETSAAQEQVRLVDDMFWNGVYDPGIDVTAVTGASMTITDQAGNTPHAINNGQW